MAEAGSRQSSNAIDLCCTRLKNEWLQLVLPLHAISVRLRPGSDQSVPFAFQNLKADGTFLVDMTSDRYVFKDWFGAVIIQLLGLPCQYMPRSVLDRSVLWVFALCFLTLNDVSLDYDFARWYLRCALYGRSYSQSCAVE